MPAPAEATILASSRVAVADEDGTPRVRPARLTLRRGVVEAIELEPFSAPRGPVEDCGDDLVAPAFVDAHTHLAMAAFRGLVSAPSLDGNVVEDLFFRLEEVLEPGDIRAFARVGAYECLVHGTGFVWEHYYGGTALAEALADVGLSGVVAPTLQDLSGPGRQRGEEALRATQELAEDRWRARGIFAALGPHATDTVSETSWRTVTAFARAHDLPIHAHVAQSWEEYARAHARHGCSPVELLSRLGVLDEAPAALWVHLLFADRRDLARLDPSRHVLGFCPLSQLQFGFPAPVGLWDELGLRWAVGSDAAASNDAVAVQRELPLVAGTAALATAHGPERAGFTEAGGLEAAQALEQRRRALRRGSALGDPRVLLRSVGAAAGRLHPAARAGVIEPGALANLLVVDLRHPGLWPASDPLRALAYGDVAPALRRVMVRGRWFDPRGLHESVEYGEAVREASDRLARCLQRAGA